MNTYVLASTIFTLRNMKNDVIAFANNGLTGFGRLAEQNLAFSEFRKYNLIDKNGKPLDEEVLLDALSFVINERVKAGTFV
ncbi:MAG: hypothetical protein GY804_11500 [Alphaproteobacteria bacterium]|nr:hypothetical protein [Alphaproteobacteria bacterium]